MSEAEEEECWVCGMAVTLANSQQLWSPAQGQAGKHSSTNETGAQEAPPLAEGPLVSNAC